MKPILSKTSKLLLPPLSHLSPLPLPPPPPSTISFLTDLILTSNPPSSLPSALAPHLRLLSSSPLLLPSLLSHLFSSHSPSLLSFHLFLFSLSPSFPFPPSPSSFHLTLLTLSRSRDFPLSLRLFRHLSLHQPSLLSPHSLSILLSRFAKFQPFPQTLQIFDQLDQIFAAAGQPFGVDHFNALLRAFCTQSRMGEARAVFNQLHARFPPNSKTLNTLLLGFRQAGNLLAFEVFYNEMVLRGFEPDVVTFNIRIDAYCKKNRFSDAVEVFEEMERRGFKATVETMTTLIHGAGIARNHFRACRVFDEIAERGLAADRGAYNALLGALVRVGDLKGGKELMDEMEGKGLGVDDVSYYTLFCGLRKRGNLEGVCELYERMVDRRFLPRVRTVMLLMKFFCESGRSSDLGLGLWDYLVSKGCCPHRHALDLLVTGLCCCKKVEEAYRCFTQVVEKGRWPSEKTVLLLEGVFKRSRKREKLDEMKKMMEGLESALKSSSSSRNYDEEGDESLEGLSY